MHETLTYSNTIALLRLAKYLSVADLEAAAKVEKEKAKSSTLGVRHLWAAAGLFVPPARVRFRKSARGDADRLPGPSGASAERGGTDAPADESEIVLPDRRMDDAAGE